MTGVLGDAYSRLANELIHSMRPAPSAQGHSVVATGDKDPLTNAREYLRALKEGKWVVMTNPGDTLPTPFATEDPDFILIALRNSLALAGKGASALDPAKSDKEMEEEIRRAAQGDYIRIARENFASLSHYHKEYKPIEEPYESLRSVKEYSLGDRVSKSLESTEPQMRWMLKQAGADASALDPTGTKSAEQMEKEVAQATKQGQIAAAREDFSMALTSEDPVLIKGFVESTREHLAKAGADASALDPEGKKSAKVIGDTLTKLYKDANVEWARERYAWMQRDMAELPKLRGVDVNIQRMLIDSDRTEIQKTLSEAGVGPEVLNGATVQSGSPKASNVAIVRMFANSDAVDKVVQAFNDAGHDRKLSAADRDILRNDAGLAEALFGYGGIKDLVGEGLATVAELHGKPSELLDTIRNPRVANAIREGVTGVRELAEVPTERLKDAQYQLFGGQYEAAAQALGLDAEHARRFVTSANRTEEALMKPGLHPNLHVNDYRPFMHSPDTELTWKR